MRWLTSMNKKRHQREMNRLVRQANKSIENDSLWLGRFVILQVNSPQWSIYEDKSGADYLVHLKIIDRCTGRFWISADTVNGWRTALGNGWHLYEFINWFIVEYCNVWEEPLAHNYDLWRAYNGSYRKGHIERKENE